MKVTREDCSVNVELKYPVLMQDRGCNDRIYYFFNEYDSVILMPDPKSLSSPKQADSIRCVTGRGPTKATDPSLQIYHGKVILQNEQ